MYWNRIVEPAFDILRFQGLRQLPVFVATDRHQVVNRFTPWQNLVKLNRKTGEPFAISLGPGAPVGVPSHPDFLSLARRTIPTKFTFMRELAAQPVRVCSCVVRARGCLDYECDLRRRGFG